VDSEAGTELEANKVVILAEGLPTSTLAAALPSITTTRRGQEAEAEGELEAGAAMTEEIAKAHMDDLRALCRQMDKTCLQINRRPSLEEAASLVLAQPKTPQLLPKARLRTRKTL